MITPYIHYRNFNIHILLTIHRNVYYKQKLEIGTQKIMYLRVHICTLSSASDIHIVDLADFVSVSAFVVVVVVVVVAVAVAAF